MTETSNLKSKSVQEDETSFRELINEVKIFIRYLISRWVIILISGLIGGLIGLGYSIFKSPVYNAELSFAVEDTKSAGGLGGAYSSIASQFGLDIGGTGGVFSGDNLLELMRSRSLVEKTLLTPEKIDGKIETLADLYIDCNKLRKDWSDKPEIANIHFLPNEDRTKFSLTQDSILGVIYDKILASNLSVDKIDKKLSIIVVQTSSKNELFSKFFTEVLVNKVADFYIDTKTKKSNKNVTILQNQVDSVRKELNLSIYGVAKSIDVNPNANPNMQVLKTGAQHKQVDVQVNTAILSELVKNLEVAKVMLRNETPLIQIIDSPILPLKKVKTTKTMGIIIGFSLFFVLSIACISINKIYQNLLK